jgi:superfamily II DNA/RNA helicase
MPLVSNEGPVGLVICPSRELARQTWEVTNGFVDEVLPTLVIVHTAPGKRLEGGPNKY